MRNEGTGYRQIRAVVEQARREQRWLRAGIAVFVLCALAAVSSRAGFLHSLLIDTDEYTRHDLARIWLIPLSILVPCWLSAAIAHSVRSAGDRWNRRLPVAWQARTTRRPGGSVAAGMMTVALFVLAPVVALLLLIDRYMKGEACRDKALLVRGWTGHLFGDTPPSMLEGDLCAQMHSATRTTYGRSMDYWPYFEPWLLVSLVALSLSLALLFLKVTSGSRESSRTIARLRDWLHAWDMRSLTLFRIARRGPPRPELRHDVFVSYSGADRSVAMSVRDDLERRGLDVWLDHDDVRPGQDFVERMRDGLVSSRRILVLLSHAFLASDWAMRELYTALTVESARGERALLPVLVDVPPEIVGAAVPELANRNMPSLDEARDAMLVELLAPDEAV